MKCNHQNGSLSEFGISITEHSFENGAITSSHSDFGSYTGQCEFKCDDCGKTLRFNSLSEKLPTWAKEKVKEIRDE